MNKLIACFLAAVMISWDQNTEADLAGYRIYWGDAPRSYAHVVSTRETSCVIDGLPGDQCTYFAVTAFDTAGNESAFSDEVSICFQDSGYVRPVKPHDLRVNGIGGSEILTVSRGDTLHFEFRIPLKLTDGRIVDRDSLRCMVWVMLPSRGWVALLRSRAPVHGTQTELSAVELPANVALSFIVTTFWRQIESEDSDAVRVIIRDSESFVKINIVI